MTETVTVDDLSFEIRRSSRRKTLELIVDRGGELVVAAPAGLASEAVVRFVEDRQAWIHRKLAAKRALRQPEARKDYVTGESFLYLGRRHRLLLVAQPDRVLKLEGGRFRLDRLEAGRGRVHFVEWYTVHGRAWLPSRVEAWRQRLGVQLEGVEVRDLAYRWASCGKNAKLNFHWAVVLLPPNIIDYLIVHELVHLLEPNHTPAFWRRVQMAIPDYQARKKWLAENGGAVMAL
jgi:hypothetical protein